MAKAPAGGNADSSPDNRLISMFDDTLVLSLGVVLAVAVGVFLAQIGFVFQQDLHHSSSSAVSVLQQTQDLQWFLVRNQPTVCRTCYSKATADGLETALLHASKEGKTVPIRMAARKSNATTLFSRTRNNQGSSYMYEEQEMKLSVENLHQDTTSSHHYYAAQVDIHQHLPEIVSHINEPAAILESMGRTAPLRKNLTLYWGQGPLVTPTHYDSLENWLCVAKGTKVVTLLDPASASHYLYIDRKVHANGSPIERLDRLLEDYIQEYPLARYAVPMSVSLQTGDCLYIPVYWYHSVFTASGEALSINWWRTPNHNKMKELEALFCGYDSPSRAQCAVSG